MPRNKYPEQTVERILKASYSLFIKKGYDNVSIQDIVNNLGDMTKGAIYHHFKSKDEILSSIFDKMCEEYSIEKLVKRYPGLNALDKIKMSFKEYFDDEVAIKINLETMPLMHNPHIFAQLVETVLKVFSLQIEELIKQGIKDGSMSVDPNYTKEAAQVFSLLSKVWLLPTLSDDGMEDACRKIDMLKVILDAIGIPVLDEEMSKLSKQYIRRFYMG